MTPALRPQLGQATARTGCDQAVKSIIGDALRAKTGYIESVHSLAGVVRTVGGAELVFGVFAMNIENARQQVRLALRSNSGHD